MPSLPPRIGASSAVAHQQTLPSRLAELLDFAELPELHGPPPLAPTAMAPAATLRLAPTPVAVAAPAFEGGAYHCADGCEVEVEEDEYAELEGAYLAEILQHKADILQHKDELFSIQLECKGLRSSQPSARLSFCCTPLSL